MRFKELEAHDGAKTYALVFDAGDEVMRELAGFIAEQSVRTASFTAIGALSDVTLGYLDWETRRHEPIPISEQVEVLALTGDVVVGEDGQARAHAHIVVGKSDGTAHGGHLLSARVRPTLELILTTSPTPLHKRFDEQTGRARIAI